MSLILKGREVVGEKCQSIYSSSGDKTRLTYRRTMHTAYKGSKVEPVARSASSELVDPVDRSTSNTTLQISGPLSLMPSLFG